MLNVYIETNKSYWDRRDVDSGVKMVLMRQHGQVQTSLLSDCLSVSSLKAIYRTRCFFVKRCAGADELKEELRDRVSFWSR